MANYNYRSQFIQSNAAGLTKLLLRVSIGATGAPTLVSGTGMGIKSVTRSAIGAYVIALSKPFKSLLAVDVQSISGAAAPAAPLVNIVTDASSSLTAPAITIQCRNNTGVATDPASGEILLMEIDLNSSGLSN